MATNVVFTNVKRKNDMKTTDLRIGNFIQDQFGDVITVDGLDDIDVFASGFGDIPVHAVKPIAITQQWLLDFGFESIEGGVLNKYIKKGSLVLTIGGFGLVYASVAHNTVNGDV